MRSNALRDRACFAFTLSWSTTRAVSVMDDVIAPVGARSFASSRLARAASVAVWEWWLSAGGARRRSCTVDIASDGRAGYVEVPAKAESPSSDTPARLRGMASYFTSFQTVSAPVRLPLATGDQPDHDETGCDEHGQ